MGVRRGKKANNGAGNGAKLYGERGGGKGECSSDISDSELRLRKFKGKKEES